MIRKLKDSILLTESTRAKLKLTFSPTTKIGPWDTLSQAIHNINKCINSKEIIKKLPKILINLIDYDKFSIIFPDKVLYKTLNIKETNMSSEGGVNIERVYHNGVWVKVLSIVGCPCSMPAFNNLTELIVGRRK